MYAVFKNVCIVNLVMLKNIVIAKKNLVIRFFLTSVNGYQRCKFNKHEYSNGCQDYRVYNILQIIVVFLKKYLSVIKVKCILI